MSSGSTSRIFVRLASGVASIRMATNFLLDPEPDSQDDSRCAAQRTKWPRPGNLNVIQSFHSVRKAPCVGAPLSRARAPPTDARPARRGDDRGGRGGRRRSRVHGRTTRHDSRPGQTRSGAARPGLRRVDDGARRPGRRRCAHGQGRDDRGSCPATAPEICDAQARVLGRAATAALRPHRTRRRSTSSATRPAASSPASGCATTAARRSPGGSSRSARRSTAPRSPRLARCSRARAPRRATQLETGQRPAGGAQSGRRDAGRARHSCRSGRRATRW